MTLILRRFVVFQRQCCAKYVSSKANFKYEFKQDSARNRFILKFNGSQAHIDYEKSGKHYTLKHLEVPEKHKGKGLGTMLAEKTFKHIINEKAVICIECEYLMQFFMKNPKKYVAHVVMC